MSQFSPEYVELARKAGIGLSWLAVRALMGAQMDSPIPSGWKLEKRPTLEDDSVVIERHEKLPCQFEQILWQKRSATSPVPLVVYRSALRLCDTFLGLERQVRFLEYGLRIHGNTMSSVVSVKSIGDATGYDSYRPVEDTDVSLAVVRSALDTAGQ